MKKILGGYTIDFNMNRNQLGAISEPKELDIERFLSIFSKASGVLCMRIYPEPDLGGSELTLYADNGKFLITLNEKTSGDQIVRTLRNDEIGGDFESILGEMYPASAVTHNIRLAIKVFNEFNETGNVSRTILI